MKFRNTTDFPDYFLRRMLSWVCQAHGYPVSKIRRIDFLNCSDTFRGRAWYSGRLLIRIGTETKERSYHSVTRDGLSITWNDVPAECRIELLRQKKITVDGKEYVATPYTGIVSRYPISGQYPGRKNAPKYTLEDRIEALVIVTAHEVAHLVRWQHTTRNREARVDGMALEVLNKFRADREALLAAWNDPPNKADKPKLSRAEQNEAKARAMLAKWESELEKRKRAVKSAQKKITEYRRKVRRYDRIAAKTID